MYCINCGVKLGDSEDRCPLCGTVPYHPDISRIEFDPLFPKNQHPVTHVSKSGFLILVSVLFLLPVFITLLCDIKISGGVTWSGYVIGALVLAYEVFILPLWFKSPNPAVFVPCGFAAAGLYLLYINLVTSGDWFLSFAFPIVGAVGLVVTAMAVLLKYLRRGKLYVVGGGLIAAGLLFPLTEFLLHITFDLSKVVLWSMYPLASLVLLGGLLIFLAIYPPARESMERKFFI